MGVGGVGVGGGFFLGGGGAGWGGLGRASTAFGPDELCACGPRFPRGGTHLRQPIHLRPEASADLFYTRIYYMIICISYAKPDNFLRALTFLR